MDFAEAQSQIGEAVEWLRLLIESLSAAVIAVGLLVAMLALARHALKQQAQGFLAVRLLFARYLILALELQLAADILSTAIAPSWERIGQLAAIALIRTGLNYFLEREIRMERAEAAEAGRPPAVAQEPQPRQ